MKFEDIILKSILQVRKECHFFAALMMFANIYPSKKIDTAEPMVKIYMLMKIF